MIFEGPVGGCGGVVVVVLARFGGGIRRLLDLASNILLVEEDMLDADVRTNTIVAL